MARRNNPEEEILQDEFLDEAANTSDEWMGDEELGGQLAVDVYQTKDSVVVKAPIAGVRPDDIDIAISEDVMTIRGDRKEEIVVEKEHYYVQECFWGSFSRSISAASSPVLSVPFFGFVPTIQGINFFR